MPNPGGCVRPAFALLLAAWILAGCGSGEGGHAGGTPSGPTLVPVDSVLLAESDSVYIGKPGKPAIDPYDGSLYVPDYFSNQVYRFGRDGRLQQVYGGPGEGPGELQAAGAVFIPDDSTLAVVDAGNTKIAFFDRATGGLRRELSIPASTAQAAPLLLGDTVWMHVRRVGSAQNLVRLDLSNDSLTWSGRFPGPYLTSLEQGGRYFRFHGLTGYLAEKDGRILHGYHPLQWIYVRDREGTIVDSIYVPAVRRRPVPPDLQRRIDVEKIDLLDALELHAALFGLHVLPNGMVVLDHQDWKLLSRDVIPPPNTATVWISLLSEDLERACVDTRLSESEDAKPMEVFRADTVFQFERRLVGASDSSRLPELQSWIRIVRIEPAGCDWIPARLPPDRR